MTIPLNAEQLTLLIDIPPAPNGISELLYTLNLVRTLDLFVDQIGASQERIVVGEFPKLAFDRALARTKEGLIGIMRDACDELGPVTPDVHMIERQLEELGARVERAKERLGVAA